MKTLFEAIRELPEGAKPEDYEVIWGNGVWVPLHIELSSKMITPFKNLQIRRKQKMLEINGIKYPEPCREMPPKGTECYCIRLDIEEMISSFTFGGYIDSRLLERGLVHLTKEAAIQHVKAILGIREETE